MLRTFGIVVWLGWLFSIPVAAQAQQPLPIIGNGPQGPICAGPLGPGPCAAIEQWLAQNRAPAQAQQPLPIIGNGPQGPICAGPLGPGPCAAIQQYLMQRYRSSPPSINPQQIEVISNAPNVGPICNGPLGPGACALVQQYILDHISQEPLANQSTLQNIGSLDAQHIAEVCAGSAKLDVAAFTACTGQQIILPQSEQEILDCAVSNPTAQGFANCAAPQFGYRLSDDQRAIASCAMKSEGDSSDFLDCAGSAVVGGELTPDEQAVLNCAKESNGDTSDFASCSASSLIDTHATREQKIAIECAVQSQGDYTGMAACAGANLFNLQLNPDQQIAVECVVDTGGQPYAAAGCIATRLTARELGNLCTGRYAATAWHESDDD